MIDKNKIDEYSLIEIINNLWVEKILILSISLLFSVFTFLYLNPKPKTFKTTIVLRDIPNVIFSEYEYFNNIKEFHLVLRNTFIQELNSFDNLDLFASKNSNFISYKNSLNKATRAKGFFINKFGKEKLGTRYIENKYYLIFPQGLKGDDFLNDYVMFTFRAAEEIVKNNLETSLLIEKNKLNKNLLIAKELNIKDSNVSENSNLDLDSINIRRAHELLRGSAVIKSDIKYVDELLDKLKNQKLDFNPVLDRASTPQDISPSTLRFVFLAFIAGLFLSIMYVMVRNTLKLTDS